MSLNILKRVLQIACLQTCLMAPPALAANQLFLNVGPAEFSIDVQTLKTFGQTGKGPSRLEATLAELEPQQAQQIQQLFATRIKINSTRLSRFLYTPQGEILLRELGQVLQSESGLSGFYGLRAALFQAAQLEDLTIPTVLRQFPGARIRINQARLFELAAAWERFNQQSQVAIANISDYKVPSMSQFSLEERLDLMDSGDFRSFTVTQLMTPEGDHADLYLPQQQTDTGSAAPYPVIVISHGLGGDRSSFTYLAKHYASHGFAVVVPAHPLANRSQDPRQHSLELTEEVTEDVIQVDAMFEDDWAQEISLQDFAQRPQSVSQLLDELELRSETDPLLKGQLNLAQVGVAGQSFGAYGALALGGAAINFDYLEQQCPADAMRPNPSLVLQCRALGLADGHKPFADARIKAVAALNPLGSALFGPEGMGAIDVPVLMLGGSEDKVTPALAEQIQPFGWLKTGDCYLMMLAGGTHFSLMEDADDLVAIKQLKSAKRLLGGKSSSQAKRELKATSLAFFRTHLAGQSSYRKFLLPVAP